MPPPCNRFTNCVEGHLTMPPVSHRDAGDATQFVVRPSDSGTNLLEGTHQLWELAVQARNPVVAAAARDFLVSLHTRHEGFTGRVPTVSPSLAAVFRSFIEECVVRLRSAADSAAGGDAEAAGHVRAIIALLSRFVDRTRTIGEGADATATTGGQDDAVVRVQVYVHLLKRGFALRQWSVPMRADLATFGVLRARVAEMARGDAALMEAAALVSPPIPPTVLPTCVRLENEAYSIVSAAEWDANKSVSSACAVCVCVAVCGCGCGCVWGVAVCVCAFN